LKLLGDSVWMYHSRVYLNWGNARRKGLLARRVARVKFVQRPPGEVGCGSAGNSPPPPPSESPPFGAIHATK